MNETVETTDERGKPKRKDRSTRGKLKKIPNCPGLYRHVSGKYYMIRKIKGKIITQCLETTDQTTAKRILEGRTQSLILEENSPPVEMPTLQTLCTLYLETKAGKTQGMIKNYRWVIRRLEGKFKKFTWPIDQIRQSDLAVYFVELGKSLAQNRQEKEERKKAKQKKGDPPGPEIKTDPSSPKIEADPRSFNHFTEIVSQIFELAVSDGYLSKNPVLLVPKADRRKTTETKKYTQATIPTAAEFEQIVASIRSQEFSDTRESSADFVEFCGLAALGEAEVHSLDWRDIDWTAQRIHIVRQKTHKSFYVPFFPWLESFLADLWQRNGKPTTGRIFAIRSAKQAIYNACRRLGFTTLYSPRDFRKMGIIRQIRAGLDVKMVSKFQGHSDGGRLIYDTYTKEFDRDEADREKKIIAGLKV